MVVFSVSKLNFPIIANEWFKAINSMNYPVIMTEAIMSIVLANKKISPYCDIEDIKYHNKIAKNKTSYNVAEYKILEKVKSILMVINMQLIIMETKGYQWQ